jgi:hypothetical protein
MKTTMKFSAIVVALVTLSTPTHAMSHRGIECGPYKFMGTWNKKDRDIFARVDEWSLDSNWHDVSAKLNADLNRISANNAPLDKPSGYRYRGYLCRIVPLNSAGEAIPREKWDEEGYGDLEKNPDRKRN